MEKLKRHYEDLSKHLKKNKVLLIFGPRQVGKTTLLKTYLSKTSLKFKLDQGDNIQTQNTLGSRDAAAILEYAEGYELIAIDEAQMIPNIGYALKILVDQKPDLTLIATGSSSFDLAQSVGEPLTGRKTTLTLYPVAQLELLNRFNKHELKSQLETSLIFGHYPDITFAETRQEKIELLKELVDAYLLRDILALEKIKKSETLLKLVQLLAFQVGQLVSHHELATSLRIDVKTVGRYLGLLEKSFVICKLSGLSRNLRNEISRKHKYYFLDNGVRNAVIAQFNPISMRDDIGQLWENFIFTERLKSTSYHKFYGNRYFWRTYTGQEIDFIEEAENFYSAFEAKRSTTKSVKPAPLWKQMYSNSNFHVISPNNYLDFVI